MTDTDQAYSVTAGEWQTIETAPRDGTRVLIFSVDEVVVAHYEVTHYEDDMWCENEYDNLWHHPTHWMPLPPPPEAD